MCRVVSLMLSTGGRRTNDVAIYSQMRVFINEYPQAVASKPRNINGLLWLNSSWWCASRTRSTAPRTRVIETDNCAHLNG